MWAASPPSLHRPLNLLPTQAARALLGATLSFGALAGCDDGAGAGGSGAATGATSTRTSSVTTVSGPGAATTGASTTGASASTGMPDLSCLDSPSLSDVERSLIQMPADSWKSLPGTAFSPFCTANEKPGLHGCCGCREVVEAWSGGMFDDAGRQMVLFGGGHTNYWGNELYGFDLHTATWRIVKEATPIAGLDQLDVDPLYDGNPVSRHTYDTLVYIGTRGKMLMYGGSVATNGGGVATTWLYDFATATWTLQAGRLNQFVPHYFVGTAYDPITDAVYMRDEYGLHRYDLVADEWTQLADFSGGPKNGSHTRRGIVDPARRLFIAGGGELEDGSLDILAYDLDAKVEVPYETTGDDTALRGVSAGWDIDARSDKAVAWSGGAPGILDLATRTWTVGASANAPETQTPYGTFGRLRYVSYLNVFILVSRADDDVHFYKLTPGCGT